MEPRDWTALAALYVAVYYAVARMAMRKLKSVDPDRYAELGAKPSVGMQNSFAIGRMLFDRELPKRSYPASVSGMITVARYMLFLSPVVLLGVISVARIVG
jgi:hypothetical protein